MQCVRSEQVFRKILTGVRRGAAILLAERLLKSRGDPQQIDRGEYEGDESRHRERIDAHGLQIGRVLEEVDARGDCADRGTQNKVEAKRHADETHAFGAVFPGRGIGHRSAGSGDIAAHATAEEPRNDEQHKRAAEKPDHGWLDEIRLWLNLDESTFQALMNTVLITFCAQKFERVRK